jgi:hypothetical protein
MGKSYVIYYGWLTNERGELTPDAKRIVEAAAPLLIAPLRAAPPATHVNLSPQVLSRLHAAGTEVIAYIDTDYGKVPLEVAQQAVNDALAAGVDGVFYDRTTAWPGGVSLDYYGALSEPVKAAGKLVIANPGVSQCGDMLLRFADRVMLEHKWRNLKTDSPWTVGRLPEIFMGVSSNEHFAMGYSVDEQRALADTREAWEQGIGWHASTDMYRHLPVWFEAYVQGLKG